MGKLIYTVKEVRRIDDKRSPNISAAVSVLPENNPENLFARGYVLSKKNGSVLDIYGGLKKAAEHFGEVFQQMIHGDTAYLITIISANIEAREKDLFCYPFEYSPHDNSIVRAEPFIVKNGIRMTWQMREGGDHHMILGDEERHRRTRSFKEFATTFPFLIDLKYLPEEKFTITTD
jgi:hypothetical protein